jgi:hypothetical protein
MIPRDGMQPASEITHFIPQQVTADFLKDFNDGILAFVLAVHVVHADGKRQVAIAVKKNFNALRIARLLIINNQLAVAF